MDLGQSMTLILVRYLNDDFLITIPTQAPSKEDIYQLVQDKEKFDAFIQTKLQKFLDYNSL